MPRQKATTEYTYTQVVPVVAISDAGQLRKIMGLWGVPRKLTYQRLIVFSLYKLPRRRCKEQPNPDVSNYCGTSNTDPGSRNRRKPVMGTNSLGRWDSLKKRMLPGRKFRGINNPAEVRCLPERGACSGAAAQEQG